MAGLRVEPLDPADRGGVRRWVALPHRIYAGDPNWTPPLRRDAAREAAGIGPSGVETVRFLALRGSRTAGRLAVSADPDDPSAGLLSGFEADDDPDVATALLEAAARWASGRRRTAIAGPRGRLLFGMATGLQVEGFAVPAPAGTPHHRPYYHRLWEAAGMETDGELVSLSTTRDAFRMPEGTARWEETAAAAGYTVPPPGGVADLEDRSLEIVRLANAAMAGLPNWLPLAEADTAELVERLRPLVVRPDLFRLLLHEGRLVGFAAAWPEVGAAIRRSRGRLVPFGWWRLLRERRRTDAVTFLVICIDPAHQGAGAGLTLGMALARTLVDDARIRRVAFPLGDIDNDRSLALVAGISGAEVDARFRVYRRPIGAGR